MTQAIANEFVQQIAEDVSQKGFKVTVGPSRIPNRTMWRYDPPSLIRGLKFTPDLLIENSGKFAIVEARTRPFLFGGVADARKMAEYFGAPAIICVPDEVLREIPGSVLRFAVEERVQVTPFSGLTGALIDSFSSPTSVPGGVR
ncbi:MAG: hypothetical protein OXR67_06980 [Chloroflexota bacterium]|nr:hypothetical protein [Chloroflexota bacterium]